MLSLASVRESWEQRQAAIAEAIQYGRVYVLPRSSGEI
jgi:hypothetical protein